MHTTTSPAPGHATRPNRILAARRLVCFVGCLAALHTVVHAGGTVSAPSLADETNDVRIRSGLSTLTLHPLLSRIAQAKAEDMASRGYFSHTTPEGQPFYALITGAGYVYRYAAENLAVGLGADEALIAAWMASPGHRQNILNERYTDIGIGVAYGRYKGQDTVFVVQVFGTPKAASFGPASQ